MSNFQSNKYMEDFMQVFVNSITNTLSKTLDVDVCNKLGLALNLISKVNDVESIKENSAIYKLDYATGNRQGSLGLLIPEEFIANISDILTGGEGKDVYKGSLSEIETNANMNVLEKIFKNIESDFKKYYDYDLVFSANIMLLLKEKPNYSISATNGSFDFVVDFMLNLTKENEYNIKILLNLKELENLMKDMGISDNGPNSRKNGNSALDIKNLSGIKINITAELGRTRVPIKYALELVRNSLIELDTVNNSDIKVFANGIEFAYAQIVAVEENFGLRITKIITPEERLKVGFKPGMKFNPQINATMPIKSEAPVAQKGTETSTGKVTKTSSDSTPTQVIEIEIPKMNFDTMPAGFDKAQAEKIINHSVKLGRILNFSQKELIELQQVAAYYNIGLTNLDKKDGLKQEFRKNKVMKSYNELIQRENISNEIAEMVKSSANSYDTKTFTLNSKIPSNHIVAISSYYEESLALNNSKQATLLKMLQLGGNRFNIFILHKFIKLMRETDD